MMSSVTVRPYDPTRDEESFWRVLSLTYNNGDNIPEGNRSFEFSKGYVAEVDGVIEGAFKVVDFTGLFRGVEMRTAGIAAVAILPHRRGGGIGTKMLNGMVNLLKEEGYLMSSLYPFSETFYRKSGYESCGKRIKITCPRERLPKTPQTLPIRLLGPADYEQLVGCYRAFAESRSGLNIRNSIQWMRVLAENRELCIYAAGDPVEAYAVISHSTSFWTVDHVSEVVWSTAAGYDSILSFLRGLAVNKNGLSWYEPSDSPFMAQYLDQGVETKIERGIMYRVLNVPEVLAKLATALRVAVTDDSIASNSGVFGPEGEVDLSVTHRQLAQIVLGEPSLQDLARNRPVATVNEKALAAFSPLPAYCLEFF